MARPTKDGLDYFPLDVMLDEKFELIESEFGLTGFAVVVKLYQRIYSRGYYCEWTNEVALLFSRSVGLGGNVVSEIVSASIRRGIFDQGMFEKYQILTSAGIQKRYFEAVSRRKDTEVDQRYLLVGHAQKIINVNNNPINVDNNSINVDINSQSKGKKSKVKESKGSITRRFTPPTIDEVRDYCIERGNNVDADTFVNFYESKGWKVGKEPMKDWKAAVRTWERGNDRGRGASYTRGNSNIFAEMLAKERSAKHHDT